jgi:tripartite-type tricarboxylate transporter receptor subunit TctC
MQGQNKQGDKVSRRRVLGAALALACAGLSGTAAAQTYPSRPIHLYVAFAPGGAGDTVARLVARKMSENLGQPIVIENRPAPMVAVVAVQQAKPDGYTLLMAGSGTALTNALFKSLPYDLMGDFIHVSTLASFDLALLTSPASSLKSVQDVVAYARAHPGKLNIGTVRVGSTQNLAAEMFKAMAGIDAVIVPYRTTGDLLTAVRTKDVQVAFEILPPILSQVKGNVVKPLAVTSNKRFPALPDVPTVTESGIPGFEASSWNGLSVPARTPPEVVARLVKGIQAAVASPEVQKDLERMGMVAKAGTPEEMTRRMSGDIAKWGAVIEKAGIEKQ